MPPPLTIPVLGRLPATGGLSPSKLWHLVPRPVGRRLYDHRLAVGRALLAMRRRGLVERVAAAHCVTTAAGRAAADAGRAPKGCETVSPERQTAISRQGGLTAAAQRKGNRFTSETARAVPR